MAKKKQPEMEALEIPGVSAGDENEVDVAGVPEVATVKAMTVMIELPVIKPAPGAYRSGHYDVQLTARQKEAHRWLFDGANGSATRMANGQFVQHARHVPQLILDRVADAIKIPK